MAYRLGGHSLPQRSVAVRVGFGETHANCRGDYMARYFLFRGGFVPVRDGSFDWIWIRGVRVVVDRMADDRTPGSLGYSGVRNAGRLVAAHFGGGSARVGRAMVGLQEFYSLWGRGRPGVEAAAQALSPMISF